MSLIVPGSTGAADVARAEAWDALRARAREHASHALSDRTWQLYAADWRHFLGWCQRMGQAALPASAETVALYLTDLASQVDVDGTARLKPSTIARRKAAIASAHRHAGHPSPTASDEVALVLRGIRRDGDSTVRRMRPLLLADVQHVIDSMDHRSWPVGVKSARDTLVLLFGFAGALRRSSVAGLNIADVTVDLADGLHVRLQRSKTDQDGVGALLALPYGRHPATCPPCAFVRWLRLLEAPSRAERMRLVFSTSQTDHVCRSETPRPDPEMPLFRPVRADGSIGVVSPTTQTLYRVVKTRMLQAGLSPDGYGFHSLRSGFVTQARRNGASRRDVRRQTLHASDQMVDVYDREYNPLVGGNAVTVLGL